MSTLIDGSEDMVGQNVTPGAEYPIFNTLAQKQALRNLETTDYRFNGTLHVNDTVDPSSHPLLRLVAWVEVIVNGTPPSGGSLTIQLLVGGVAQSPAFSVASSGTYNLTSFLPTPTMQVPASTTLAAQVVTPNGATDVLVRVRSYLVIP